MKKQKQQTTKSASQNVFRWKWMSNFLSNVLGVIVGIALTFGVSYLVQRNGEKKEIRTMMTLVKQEIADNKVNMAELTKDYQRTKELCGLLLSSEWKTLPQDSVWHLLLTQGVYLRPFKRTSWDIFQNSNVIRNFDDVELILAISEQYIQMTEAYKWWQIYTDEYLAASPRIKPDTTDLQAHIGILLKNEKLCRFMENTCMVEEYPFEELFGVNIDLADYVLHLIDKSGNYQSDVRDLNEDFEKFRENKAKESEKENYQLR